MWRLQDHKEINRWADLSEGPARRAGSPIAPVTSRVKCIVVTTTPDGVEV
jgi:hypothetical protein